MEEHPNLRQVVAACERNGIDKMPALLSKVAKGVYAMIADKNRGANTLEPERDLVYCSPIYRAYNDKLRRLSETIEAICKGSVAVVTQCGSYCRWGECLIVGPLCNRLEREKAVAIYDAVKKGGYSNLFHLFGNKCKVRAYMMDYLDGKMIGMEAYSKKQAIKMGDRFYEKWRAIKQAKKAQKKEQDKEERVTRASFRTPVKKLGAPAEKKVATKPSGPRFDMYDLEDSADDFSVASIDSET